MDAIKKPAMALINDDDVNVRTGPQADAAASGKKLNSGQAVKVLGYSLDSKAEDRFRLRYQIELDGQVLWIAGVFADFEKASDRRGIPFVGDSSQLIQLLAEFGISLEAGVSLTQEVGLPLLDVIAQYQLIFKDTLNLADLRLLHEMITDLELYGVYLGIDKGGRWNLKDLKRVYQAVVEMAQGSADLFEQIYGFRDEKMFFRVLYGPFRIDRNPTNNVSTQAGQVWWARNGNGYELVLSNKVFFEGDTRTARSPKLTFSSLELIAHEIAHVLNWRYMLRNDKNGLVAPDDYYLKMQRGVFELANGDSVKVNDLNDGYVIAPRSSDGKYEVVTDAFTSLSLNRFADSKQGQLRREQAADVLRRVILYRVNEFGGLQALRDRVLKQWKQNVFRRMQPGFALLAEAPTHLDDDLAALKSRVTAL